MKWICYMCDCGCGFAVEYLSDNGDPNCPRCGSDLDVTSTGECMRDPHIEFDGD